MRGVRETVLAGAAVLAGSAFSHEAPAGWAYGVECCSNQDCRQVRSDEIDETKEGYFVRASSTLVRYGSYQIKRSRDEFFHVCTIGGTPKGAVLCVYVPDRGF